MATKKTLRKQRIKYRIRKSITGTTVRPRLTVFRSNRHIYAQLIDDQSKATIASAGSLLDGKAQSIPKKEQAKLVGKAIAEKAIKSGIKTVVFDRNGYLYHGRVRSLAEAAREAGLKL